MEQEWKSRIARFAMQHGTLVALILLCLFFSLATLSKQTQTGTSAGRSTGTEAAAALGNGTRVLVLAAPSGEEEAFTAAARQVLEAGGITIVDAVNGDSPRTRTAIREALASDDQPALDAIVCSGRVATLPFVQNLASEFPRLAGTRVFTPGGSYWPRFLNPENVVNLLNQISIYAILAIGMTLVIITGGIDLSVGSLVAFSAVLCATLIRDWMGAEDAGVLGMILCSLLAILASGAGGLLSGAVVTVFRIPPFIVTLSMMLVASGLAYILAGGATISQVPVSFKNFASGEIVPRIPNAVTMTAILYALAHVLMTRTVLGRYIYAVGGNPEAARLSGVPVKRVLLFVYTACGLLAGLGGVVYASQFHTASARYGEQYELTVIAAVVVGGTSLFGGEGRILGTLVGALLLAVIFNGMNLVGLGSYPQKVVLGLVIVGAAVLDTWRKR